MAGVGTQIIIDLFGCNKEFLNDINYIKIVLYKLVEILPAKVCDSVFYKFTPIGVSGAIIISSSHLTIHTWPENLYAGIDIFSCSANFNDKKIIDFLKEDFKCNRYTIKKIDRG